jgi:hypothetical protein
MDKCTPNKSIECSVNSCAYHCDQGQYCSLNTIRVGTHEPHPTDTMCVDCESFKPDSSCN